MKSIERDAYLLSRGAWFVVASCFGLGNVLGFVFVGYKAVNWTNRLSLYDFDLRMLIIANCNLKIVSCITEYTNRLNESGSCR
jgi:hypothetical protein